jgi:hypothetical protein
MLPPMRALALALTTLVVAGCAPHARPLPAPYRATLAVFYQAPPRTDAEGGYRADVALERWVDDRFVVGADISRGVFARTRGRDASLLGAGARVAYVLDLAEIQPRFGVRVAAERWTLSEDTRSTNTPFLSAFVGLDWAPRATPWVLGAEVLSPALALAGTSLGTAAIAYGLRGGYVF